jgi:hypothetical protein
MSPDDHAELIRLRDRIHAIADNTTVALADMRHELAQIGTHVDVLAERVKSQGDLHSAGLKRCENKIGEQGDAYNRRFDEMADDVHSIRRGLYTLAFSAIGASLVTVMGLYALFGS